LVYYKRSLEIYEITLPPDHYYIARTFASMSETYYYLQQYSTALDHLERSLALFNKSVTQTHDDFAVLYHFFGRVYEDTDRLDLALQYYEKAETTYKYTLPETHKEVVENRQHLESVRDKLE
jgi:tetratricopeptide (TPR) repeat protein